ncbi:helix-hairpin-helix domain-containing protein [Lacticaseibacillus parakribbianus]|uniref:helix-hairpin-helix domain-containing protein n=1 Tax=Lacticaseibacillus parakribbianus TaxID=2970927 RepID=UPI0021CB5426|nr:helix-hairpin-helix domain-containing protein [Lacticaseibacillus parakribbianus]
MMQVKQWAKDYWYLPLLVLAGAAFWWWQNRQPQPAPEAAPAVSASVASSSQPATAAASASSQPGPGFVYLKGAVVHPGLYPITGTTRWDAVVKAAGGLTAKADVTQVNLAKIAVDEESLYIPTVGETPPVAVEQGPTPGATTAASSSGQGLVNLNTATAAELETLSGIGPKKAADIIAYRESSGGFKTIEDIKNVSGIGDKTFEALAPSITVGP